VTVLFADFAGFTSFVRKRDMEDVRDYMTAIWARLDQIIAGHGGITEKHIGDAVMAVFGARQAREDDPVQAVRAALAMQAAVARPPVGEGQALQMRIGVHSGVVVVGPLGGGDEMAATGDAVNLANRLEQNAPLGAVLISQETYRLVYGYFNMEAQPPLALKGRTEPLQTYLVLRAKPRALAMQLRGVEGVRTRMIGRGAELKRLQTALQTSISAAQQQCVTVVGEAGMGKTCLLREFQEWVELLPQKVGLFSGRATPEMAGLPYALMRDVFSARFEIQESDPPAVAREKFERGLLGLITGAPGTTAVDEARAQAHFIGQLLGFDYSGAEELRDILKDPDQIRQQAFHYVGRFFEAISTGTTTAGGERSQGTVLILEDLQWSDDSSLDLVEYLARTWRQGAFLLVCLARPGLLERRQNWGQGWPKHLRVELGPLSRRESRALAESILSKARDIPQALRELIVGGAEGIPFYIEEIIKMLIDQKVIVPGPDQWAIEPRRLAAVRVPPTLTGVLQARIDQLGAAEKRVLQCASVVGRVFWDSAIERLNSAAKDQAGGARAGESTLSRQEIMEALAGLHRKELVFRRESSAFAHSVEYTFKHELLRNVTYETLLRKLRREHHAQAAEWLIEQSGERVGQFAGLIARHFEQAGRQLDAATWFGRAGEQARGGYAPAAAMECFQKALELLPAGESMQVQREQLQWYEGLGDTLGAQARFAEGLKVYERMRGLAEALEDRLAQARAWNGLAFLQERLGKNRASIERAERAEALARESGEAGRGERIRALHLKGWAHYRLSDAAAVLAVAEETLKLCNDFANRSGLATSYKLFGVAYLQLGHFTEADRFFQQGLKLSQELGDRRNTAAMFSNLGESARAQGDFQTAAGLYQKALTLARQIGHRESEIIYLSNLAAARLGLGQFAQVETDLRRVITLNSDPENYALAETYTFLAEALAGQQKLREALEAGRRGLALAEKSENDLCIAGAWRCLGQVLAAMQACGVQHKSGAGGTLEPENCFSRSYEIFGKMRAQAEQAHILRVWADYELKQGRTESGREKAQQAKVLLGQLAVGQGGERSG
jgi:class 3 adenylate cyclase/tetratricopeptide (TPR) repeat protein